MTEHARQSQSSGDLATTSRSAWIFSLCLTVSLVLLVLLGLSPHYEGADLYGGNSDDVRATMVASGIGSPAGPSDDLLYSNRLIGRVLCKLYTARPNVPWYGVYLTVCHLLAHFLICFAWCRVSGNWKLRLAIFSFSLAMGSYHWTALQFTTTSTLLAIAGTSLLASSLIQEASSKREKPYACRALCGWACVILAGMIRWHAALMMGIVLGPVMLLLAAWVWKRTAAWNHVAIAVIGLSTMFGLRTWSEEQWRSRPDWSEFKRFDYPTSNLINNRHVTSLFFDYETLSEDVQATLDSVGWSHNDAKVLNHWLYFDEKIFSFEAISRVNTALTSISVSWSKWLKTILSAVRLFATDPLSLLVVLLSLAILATGCGSVRAVGLLVWCVAATLAAFLYLFMKLPHHVLYPIASSAFFGTLIVSEGSRALRKRGVNSSDSPRIRNRLAAVLLSAAVLVAAYRTWHHYRLAQSGVRLRAEFLEIVEKLEKGPNHIYIIVLQFPFQRVSPYDTMHDWKDWHFLYTDGEVRSPRYYAFLKEHGIDDLTEALYSDRRVKLITIELKMQMLTEFLREHRGVETDYSIERQLPSITVFQLDPKKSIWE